MIKTWTKWFEKLLFNSDKLVNLYDKYYKDIVKKEIRLAKIKSIDKVLIIGGGAVPCTAINIASTTDARVDVIDIDEEAVKSSKELIQRLGLEDRIKIYLKDAKNIDVKNYDVIHIALLVTPKEEIVNNIWNRCSKGTRMLIRQPKKFLKIFYSNLSEVFIMGKKDKMKKICENNGFNTIDDLLLLVKD